MLTLSSAQTILTHAIQSAEDLGRSISVTVVDVAGHEVASVRMDGASWFSLGVARAKAQTAAAFQRPSAALQPMWEAHPRLVPLVEEQLAFRPTTLDGGIPLTDRDGAVVGAVGVAGALPEMDLRIAEMAAGALDMGEPS